MGLREIRTLLVDALASGRYQHEERNVVSEKNLLATEEVSAAEVILLLQRCRGDQYSASPHHFAPTIACHVFRPTLGEERWYIKAYFLSRDAVFISVHLSES